MNALSIMNLKKEILAGKIFIYPTDTVYGLGCNALDKASVTKLKEIKKRDKEKPVSVIAPSINWIQENCIVDCELKKYLPGQYTLILKKKQESFLSWISGETLGVRIPNHEFTRKLQKTGIPFVTTSVNISGEKPANKVEDIPKEILEEVDYVIDYGELSGKPSTLVIEGKEINR